MQSRFLTKKQRILEQLTIPDDQYQDLSPKGSVDEPIRPLIEDINHLQGLVTTSSCSGRVSVFLEGHKKGIVSPEASIEELVARAGPGGKGGGSWLYVSHDPVDLTPESTESKSFMNMFGLLDTSTGSQKLIETNHSYIHLKFEPMVLYTGQSREDKTDFVQILHILTATLEDSHRILTAALSAGFRESGAVSLTASKDGERNPIVAVRSAGYSFDAIIGYQNDHGENIALVDEKYLRILISIANERFKINVERITRFRSALLAQYTQKQQSSAATPSMLEWENSAARKQRKREEGLARQRQLQAHQSDNFDSNLSEPSEEVSIGPMFN
jgi:tRNA wybutosine-synthesizing protein 3